MKFLLLKIKKRVFAFLSTATDIAIFMVVVLIGGIGSSWYMVSAGTSLTTRTAGPWKMWVNEGRVDADPYTRAHFATTGRLVVSSDVAATFVATTDTEGIRLHSSCEYSIEGRDFAASWWTLAVFDANGRLIPNAADRYAYTRDTIALRPNGDFIVTLAREARPGNWLPTAGAGRIAVVLTIFEPETTDSANVDGDAEVAMPVLKKVACR